MLFLLPPPPNFAKTHARLGRGRLAVGCRDLIPPWGYTRCAGAACRGSGLCRVGVLPEAGVGVPDGGEPPGRGLCRGRPAGAGGGVPGGVLAGTAGVFSRSGAKNFFSKGPTRMYKEAVAPVWARLVDKAIFRAILWWV